LAASPAIQEFTNMKVLITGGAGFIGSRLACRLAAQADVTVLDNLSPQIHGPDASFAAGLTQVARCIRADIGDRRALEIALDGQEAVVHLAAETGTGQSMYAVEHYGRVNLGGTALLMDIIVNQRSSSLRKLVVASSRAVYGEGMYRCAEHGVVFPNARSAEAMAGGQFEPVCPQCGLVASVLPTREETPFAPSSFYGLTKQMQEQTVLMFGSALGIDALALRYQNVYGPGQSLSNPYTGLLAVFSNLVRAGKGLSIFEDGQESRDFVYVDDVVEATAACLDRSVRGVHTLNVGSGVRTSVLEVAQAVRRFFESDVPVQVTGAYRVGDIRHNAADISRISALTGFAPRWSFAQGLEGFLAWAQTQDAYDAGFERSLDELKQRGLMGAAGA
jgi:dTDP-L-rhamnose 4-epimerase